VSRVRIRKPSDDKVSAFDVVFLLVFLALIGLLVAWGAGWL
jgi:hypothetical protein